MKLKVLSGLLFTALPFIGLAQKNASDYPQDYFRKPLDIPIYLAGNFGECRPGHFHSGIDIKTQGKEDLPVKAAADGYISRIKMEKGGFGHALYITHPDGYTTLYAHLNDFAPAVQKFVRKEQYKRQKWDVDLVLMENMFPIMKGQLIGWSGNTGASTAPHVHFEIRDTRTEHPLNPQLFGLPIEDKLPPVPREVVLYYGNVYEDANMPVTLVKTADGYVPSKGKEAVNVAATNIGVGISADDFMGGSDNTITFYTARLFLDDSLQAEVTLDDIGYDETRYINAYADFKTKETQRKWVQCLFRVPGNRLTRIFTALNERGGRLDISDGGVHKVAVVLTDVAGNSSTASVYVRSNGTTTRGVREGCTPFNCDAPNEFTNPNVTFRLEEKQLYDNICFLYKSAPNSGAYSDKHSLHYSYVPIHRYFDLQLKPNKPIPIDLRNKVVMKYSDDRSTDARAAASVDKGWYKASVRNFGTYWLDIDTLPPVIRTSHKNNCRLMNAKQITFEAKDETTSIKAFSGYIDGKWVCVEQHGNRFFYKFDEHCSQGGHKFTFKVEDENGNSRSQDLTFVR
jgi:hypothetical protein